jgi:hypothetical protein
MEHTCVNKLTKLHTTSHPSIFYTVPDKSETSFTSPDELHYFQSIEALRSVKNHSVRTLHNFTTIFKIVAAEILLQLWKQIIITGRKVHNIITFSIASLFTKFYGM